MFDRQTKMLFWQTNHDSSGTNGEKFRTIPIRLFVYRPSSLCLPARLFPSSSLLAWISVAPVWLCDVHMFPGEGFIEMLFVLERPGTHDWPQSRHRKKFPIAVAGRADGRIFIYMLNRTFKQNTKGSFYTKLR